MQSQRARFPPGEMPMGQSCLLALYMAASQRAQAPYEGRRQVSYMSPLLIFTGDLSPSRLGPAWVGLLGALL